MAENPTTTQEQEAPERTFTQAEMNAIIADRLSRERAKYADYDALKKKADQFDAAQEAGKTELQKANERAAALQTQVDALTRANEVREVRGKVSAATGVPAELLSGETEEACKAQAQAILKFAKSNNKNVLCNVQMKNRQNAANHWKTKKNPGTIVAPGLFELAEKEGFEPSRRLPALRP